MMTLGVLAEWQSA